MLVDTALAGPISDAAQFAASAERAGFNTLWSTETSHDPFLPLSAATASTSEIALGTSIAVAFARNPMLLANIGWDLQALSGGRFVLGLGSQIKPHITKRFSMEWSQPAARMREMILAVRAIWQAWMTGDRLNFRGEFYRHTLMTPMFTPPSSDLEGFGVPKIFLAGVGQKMTEVAGEVADGFFCHPFTTERYLREVTIPALLRGRESAGHSSLEGFSISGPSFVVSGATDEATERSRQMVKQQIAFYGSTPAYRPVLELHGWGDAQTDLNTLSKRGEWVAMANLITDDMLEAFAIVKDPADIAAEVAQRYGDVVDRIMFYLPTDFADDVWAAVRADIQAI